MNVYDYAMQMEKDGEAFYVKIASGNTNPGIKKIFKLLAFQELSHYRTFRALKKNDTSMYEDIEFLPEIKNIFRKMSEKNKKFDLLNGQKKIYQQAQKLEKKSEAFYRKAAEKLTDKAQKEIFLKIADEEKQHFHLLEAMIEFISAPQNWLENAEWSHLEEY